MLSFAPAFFLWLTAAAFPPEATAHSTIRPRAQAFEARSASLVAVPKSLGRRGAGDATLLHRRSPLPLPPLRKGFFDNKPRSQGQQSGSREGEGSSGSPHDPSSEGHTAHDHGQAAPPHAQQHPPAIAPLARTCQQMHEVLGRMSREAYNRQLTLPHMREVVFMHHGPCLPSPTPLGTHALVPSPPYDLPRAASAARRRTGALGADRRPACRLHDRLVRDDPEAHMEVYRALAARDEAADQARDRMAAGTGTEASSRLTEAQRRLDNACARELNGLRPQLAAASCSSRENELQHYIYGPVFSRLHRARHQLEPQNRANIEARWAELGPPPRSPSPRRSPSPPRERGSHDGDWTIPAEHAPPASPRGSTSDSEASPR